MECQTMIDQRKSKMLKPSVLTILQGNEEYLTAHPAEKLTITCQWDELCDTWVISATIADTGLEKTGLKCKH